MNDLKKFNDIKHFSLSARDARIPFFNIPILSVSVENYPHPYPIRSDVVNCYPYPIRIRGSIIMVPLHRESKMPIQAYSFSTVQRQHSDFNIFGTVRPYTRFNTASNDGFSFSNSFFCPTREKDKSAQSLLVQLTIPMSLNLFCCQSNQFT